jgi:5-methylcytosine-specific restriction endonuclease McrA
VCQIRDLREKDFVAGHIDAERGGGETSIDNLIPICNKCNSCMATRNMMDYCRETYKRELVLPVRK